MHILSQESFITQNIYEIENVRNKQTNILTYKAALGLQHG